MKDEADLRRDPMKRNTALEALLAELNAALPVAQRELTVDRTDRRAKIFVFGAMRSGTTLYMQWLANTGQIAYPTNLLSRFHGAPLMGAKVQQLLTDPTYNFRNEILDFSAPLDFHSENGKTVGALAPNEFWYFWRRFFPSLADGDCSDEDLRATSDLQGFRDELNGLANIFDKPFAMKAMILNQHADVLADLFDKSLFVWVRRDPVFNIQSVLNARLRQYGNLETWYSFKIREYPRLKLLDPLHAVAGQIYAINAGLERTFASLPEDHRLVIDYEAFCRDPAQAYADLTRKLEVLGERGLSPDHAGPTQFPDTNVWTLASCSRADAEQAYAEMVSRLSAGR